MSLLEVSNVVGFTKPPRGPQAWWSNDVSVRKYAEIVASSTMGNTTAETTIASMSVPALALTNKGGIRGWAAGTVSNATSTGTVTLRAKLVVGGTTTTIAETSGISISTSTTPRSWMTLITVLGTTSSTALRGWSMATVSAPSTLDTPPSTYQGFGYSMPIVANSSSAGTLNFTMQLSVASTGVVASGDVAALETLA